MQSGKTEFTAKNKINVLRCCLIHYVDPTFYIGRPENKQFKWPVINIDITINSVRLGGT